MRLFSIIALDESMNPNSAIINIATPQVALSERSRHLGQLATPNRVPQYQSRCTLVIKDEWLCPQTTHPGPAARNFGRNLLFLQRRANLAPPERDPSFSLRGLSTMEKHCHVDTEALELHIFR
jgi:hypothetical protein